MKKTQQTEQQRTGFNPVSKKLSGWRADSPEEDKDVPEFEEQAYDEPKSKTTPRLNATAIIVAAAFEAAVPKEVRRRLLYGQALAATVVVPTTAWVAPMAKYVKSKFGDRWRLLTRDGTDRRRDATVGNDEVASNLSEGACVLGVATDDRLLPQALTAAVDIAIRIPPPDAAVLRKAIVRFTRRAPGDIAADAAAGLDLHAVVAAFRPGTGAAAIIRRLESASLAGRSASERVPDLATAVEFGEARKWGMNLAKDVKELKNNLKWRDLDRGICLHSPPGYGKSWFPKVLAKACGIPLVSTSVGSWFADSPGYLDSVIKKQREAYQLAASLASPVALLHIDEIDALPNREKLSGHNSQWWNTLVSDSLNLMDSTLAGRADSHVIIIGSTNSIERVDPALLRPGRLEKIVELKPPDLAGTINILNFHLNGELTGDLTDVGALLQGFTAAEIMHCVRTARRTARHAGRDLTAEDLARAALPIADIPPALLFRMSIHEAAHAVAAIALGIGTVRQVILREQAGTGGQTVIDFLVGDLSVRADIEARIVATLAARAAERLFTGTVSVGSGGRLDSDIGIATIQVASIHASFGMGGEALYLGSGPALIAELASNPDLRERVGRHMRALERRAARLVEANRRAVLAVASRLAEKRHLVGTEVEDIVRGRLRARRRRPPGVMKT